MRDLGVLSLDDDDWFWEFDGTPDDHRRFIAALNAAAEDDSDDE